MILIKEPFRGYRPSLACVHKENGGVNTLTVLSLSVNTRHGCVASDNRRL